MEKSEFNMSAKEVKRLEVMKDLLDGKICQKEAAKLLKRSERQIRRMLRSYKEFGAVGLVSKHKGKVSSNRLSEEFKEQVISLVKEYYPDFGPTLASEKLREEHGMFISRESLRKEMIKVGLWTVRKVKKRAGIHQSRERRPKWGELIQIDGSYHDWFEGRREKCCLIVFIDDATGEFMELRFSESETTEAYMETMKDYISEYGLPRALYSDKYGVFRINSKETVEREQLTQFGRAMKELDVEIICANSPQAKGRVERGNQTLQDRLVKELRLRGINNIGDANEFLKEYKHILSDKFAVKPESPDNAHRPCNFTEEELDRIFSVKSERIISKNLEIAYKNKVYQIQTDKQALTMRNGKAEIYENFKGKVRIFYKEKELEYKVFEKPEKQIETKSSKTLNKYLDKVIKEQDKRDCAEEENAGHQKVTAGGGSDEPFRTF